MKCRKTGDTHSLPTKHIAARLFLNPSTAGVAHHTFHVQAGSGDNRLVDHGDHIACMGRTRPLKEGPVRTNAGTVPAHKTSFGIVIIWDGLPRMYCTKLICCAVTLSHALPRARFVTDCETRQKQ
jgi:hypothetical protein